MMIDTILHTFINSTYDFRTFACPEDELSYIFPDLVEKYRLKNAICSVLQPKMVLELGVGYGYTSRAFLDACPTIQYLGIDSNDVKLGGCVDGFEWARKITSGYGVAFMKVDSIQLGELPNGSYDLIHINEHRDADSTYHNLELALQSAKWVLLDGYFENNLQLSSVTQFIHKYRSLIDHSLLIPGFAGELLVKTKKVNLSSLANTQRVAQELRECYDSSYFLTDCGGFEHFKRTGGKVLEDLRLRSIYHLINPCKGERILDMGCGRGELAYAMAQSGAQVLAVDYSQDAIDIAVRTYANAGEGLCYRQGDLLTCDLGESYDAIIASDVVEHLEPPALDRVINRAAVLLKGGGRLIIHTSPNKWHLLREHRHKRRLAAQAGFYLPKNPRSYYEDLMHINEQNPISLRRVLARHFQYVFVWTSTFPDMVGSLQAQLTRKGMLHGGSIFAIAAHSPINLHDILSLISQKRLDVSKLRIELAANISRSTLHTGEHFNLEVSVYNKGYERLSSMPPNPVHLSYQWLDDVGKAIVQEGSRNPLFLPVNPGQLLQFPITIVAPDVGGAMHLEIFLIQEGACLPETIIPRVLLSIPFIVQGTVMKNNSNLDKHDNPSEYFPPKNTKDLADKISERTRQLRVKTLNLGHAKPPNPSTKLYEYIELAASRANVGAQVPPMLRFPSPVRKLAVMIGKAVRYMAEFITEEQRAYNYQIVQILREMLAVSCKSTLELNELRNTLEMQSRSIAYLRNQLCQGQNGNIDQSHSVEISNSNKGITAEDAAFYLAYENRFRGTREMIKERMRPYIQYINLAGAGTVDRPVLDLGCGRGEWLELLLEERLVVRGNDQNLDMVTYCRVKGFDVIHADLLSCIRGIPGQSVGAVTAFQVVEHLPLTCLHVMLKEVHRILAPGGVVVLEAPNPDNITVGSSYFYQDPTHLRPLPSQLLQFMMEYYGYRQVTVQFCSPHWDQPVDESTEVARRFNHMFYGPMDYSVVGWKP